MTAVSAFGRNAPRGAQIARLWFPRDAAQRRLRHTLNIGLSGDVVNSQVRRNGTAKNLNFSGILEFTRVLRGCSGYDETAALSSWTHAGDFGVGCGLSGPRTGSSRGCRTADCGPRGRLLLGSRSRLRIAERRVRSGIRICGGPGANRALRTGRHRVTGHAESVKITYDPARITYGQLLKVFFAVAHDPTEVNRQGPDEGPQYRSDIFYANEDQKAVAEAYVRQLNAANVFRRPIATRIDPLTGFFPAEGYHQNFLVRNPDNPYIVANDLPKLRALKATFPAMVKSGK